MPKFQDATGYLLELRTSIRKDWFSAVCDYALLSGGQSPTTEEISALWGFLCNVTPYVPVAAFASPQSTPKGAVPQDFLELISGFNDFKKLSPDLSLVLSKQVTLIFGRNGSGKSSICNALKVLSNAAEPQDPIHNARAVGGTTPTFSYKFRGNLTSTTWMEKNGFGVEANKIKYFDSTVALRHISGALNPEASVELTAFRLEVFEYARNFVNALHTFGKSLVSDQRQTIEATFAAIVSRIHTTVNTTVPPFLGWQPEEGVAFRTWLETIPAFGDNEQKILESNGERLRELESALSEEGINALKAQIALLSQLLQQIEFWRSACSALDLNALIAVEVTLSQKRLAALELSRDVFPEGVDHEKHLALISASAEVFSLEAASANVENCPLCQQVLSEKAAALFRAYHDYLLSSLQAELNELIQSLMQGRQNVGKLAALYLADFSDCSEHLPSGFLYELSSIVKTVKDSLPAPEATFSSCDVAAFQKHLLLAGHAATVRLSVDRLSELWRKAVDDRAGLEDDIRKLKLSIAAQEAHKVIHDTRPEFLAICASCEVFLGSKLAVESMDTTTLLRALSLKGKEAHNDLLLSTFESILSSEYQTLCGMTMTELGIRLNTRGAEQSVIVTPLIGSFPIVRVLSEGELKVHALATFMSEVELFPNQVLIFDDPVTSFDFNYISNFCERVRDLVVQNPERQLLIFTHNWDFFANLQQVMNRSHLGQRMSVQVLEDCATVAEYSDKWTDLVKQIDALFLPPGEPNTETKERLSALLRRLIETLTNTFVFNNQRHQYKIKALRDTDFDQFTMIVPLIAPEAVTLRDLYANLSPLEHDDPRNFYSTKGKAQYQAWYAKIIGIKDAVVGRS